MQCESQSMHLVPEKYIQLDKKSKSRRGKGCLVSNFFSITAIINVFIYGMDLLYFPNYYVLLKDWSIKGAAPNRRY